MSVILRGLLICRYRRSLHVPCCFCVRAQLWHCMQSPYGILKASSSSVVTDGKVLLQDAKAYGEANNNLLKLVHFQKQSFSRLKHGSIYSGHYHLQLKQYYSTKKNVAVSTKEEKILYQDENDVDNKITGASTESVVDNKITGASTENAVDNKITGASTENAVDNKITGASINEFRKEESAKAISPSCPEVSSPSVLSSETMLTDVSKSTIDSKIGDEKLISRLQRYLLWRFTWYLKKFQQSLENEMPDTFNMFRIFSIGLKDFVIDFKDFLKVLIIISMPGSTLRALSRRDIELYYNMPGDMLRVFPILVISSIPFGQNIAFPIGYWFPKQLLCHHFWDIKQRHDFAMMSLKKRLFNARPVFRSLQALLLNIEKEVDQDRVRAIFYKLGSGIHPTPDEVVSILPLFQGHPFNIGHIIRITHLNALLRLHGKSVWFRRRRHLRDHARMLHYLDAAISREGIDALSFDQLKSSVLLRGVNPTNMSIKSMTDFLESWLRVSREIDASSYSLLLHLPIFLAYNQPSNFVLIY